MLALGLLAMALHLLAGTGWSRAAAADRAGGRFVAEVCGSHGVLQAAPAQVPGSPMPQGGHDCCTLCAAGAPLLTADMAIGVPPAPTLGGDHATPVATFSIAIVRGAHPARGPPGPA